MPGESHGQVLRLEEFLQTQAVAVAAGGALADAGLAEAAPAAPPPVLDFRPLFPDLANKPYAKLPRSDKTIAALRELGAAVGETASDADAEIPAAYTYFGQFVDHDITREADSNELLKKMQQSLDSLDFEPLSQDDIAGMKNVRTAPFDLDSVYGTEKKPTPRNGEELATGPNSEVPPAFGVRPPNKGGNHDLPRSLDKTAQIGDPRNDENTIVSQLHLAFLKFHNAVVHNQAVNPAGTFAGAQKVVRQHYQWVVIEDFLKRIVNPEIVEQIKVQRRFFNPAPDQLFMPLEFSVAAYRFGHSMVRGRYNFNLNFRQGSTVPHPLEDNRTGKASLAELFFFTQHSGPLGSDQLPANWIIEWENFLDLKPGVSFEKARAIDTRLVPSLFDLRDPGGVTPTGIFIHLAKRNLLRGYLLDLPTGQSVAEQIVGKANVISPAAILANASPAERTVLSQAHFDERTPLWYYILAEAAIQEQGQRLGVVGGTIVAETIIGLLAQSDDSILDEPKWEPTLPTLNANGKFDLRDIIRIAGVAPVAQ